MHLPLHIFEDRYKEMIAEVMSGSTEFGIVLGKGDGIVNVGCSAAVETILRRYDDGRLDLIALGRRRFIITAIDQSRSFLTADVEFFDDEDENEPAAELSRRAQAALEVFRNASGEDSTPPAGQAPLSFQLAEQMDDVDRRQAVLTMRSESERLNYLLKAIPEYMARQRQIELARRVAPLNGHARQVAGR